QSGREAIDMVIRNVLPFMAFISLIIGFILATGIGRFIADHLPHPARTLVGGGVGGGKIPAQYSLPALFAINPQVGCDFIPVGLALGEAEPETVEVGVPAVLFSRMVTGPAAVVIAYLFSFGLYT